MEEGTRQRKKVRANPYAGVSTSGNKRDHNKRKPPHRQSTRLASIPTFAWDLLTCSLMVLYLILAPYTKVEESFNLQATHDLIFHGVNNVTSYDHLEFPGVVPRTFLGPLALWAANLPLKHFLVPTVFPKATPFIYQYIVRGLLGLGVVTSLGMLRRSVSRVWGRAVASWFSLFTIVQFHLLFWASRTLPNVFALVLVNIAFSFWITGSMPTLGSRKHSTTFIPFLAFATTVFRAELAPLSAFILLTELIHRRFRLTDALLVGTISSIVVIAASIIVDSHFWLTPYFYPELRVLLFNTVEHGSVAYGVSPWHSYFTNLIPRIAPQTLPLALYATLADRSIRRFMVPVLLFIAAYSFLGHKEWRFVIYAVPILNIAAAIGVEKSWGGRGDIMDRLLGRAGKSLVMASLLLSAATTAFSVFVSVYNYPGGEALARVHMLEGVGVGGVLQSGQENANLGRNHHGAPYVHMDACVAMTGASRFGEIGRNLGWMYSKNESHVLPTDYDAAGYTHVLTCSPQMLVDTGHWVAVDVVEGYDGLKRADGGLKGWARRTVKSSMLGKFSLDGKRGYLGVEIPIWIRLAEKVWILKKI
ncbi:dolichyl-P-Man:Man(7)GlcNAc(2)-PP-dolichol alpha-1,6-mannosyltransferase [Rhizophlyctis rosea]|nr:dolichyl-P-Man:Man(7)GlcNAc(2)-PP-dolichol alpha-1,6-mannosyltransferase [Rhizophlyctis rosea]